MTMQLLQAANDQQIAGLEREDKLLRETMERQKTVEIQTQIISLLKHAAEIREKIIAHQDEIIRRLEQVHHLLHVENGNLQAKVRGLRESWQWGEADRHNLTCEVVRLQELCESLRRVSSESPATPRAHAVMG
jgi:hypothetical protein